jgi:hypothetical protein
LLTVAAFLCIGASCAWLANNSIIVAHLESYAAYDIAHRHNRSGLIVARGGEPLD